MRDSYSAYINLFVFTERASEKYCVCNGKGSVSMLTVLPTECLVRATVKTKTLYSTAIYHAVRRQGLFVVAIVYFPNCSRHTAEIYSFIRYGG